MFDPKKLTAIVNKFAKDRKTEISPGAREVLRILINSVEEDPTEGWTMKKSQSFEAFFAQCAAVLPQIPDRIHIDQGAPGRLSAVDVAYWFGRNYENLGRYVPAAVCPFFPRRASVAFGSYFLPPSG
jgi:hypothetical protein